MTQDEPIRFYHLEECGTGSWRLCQFTEYLGSHVELEDEVAID